MHAPFKGSSVQGSIGTNARLNQRMKFNYAEVGMAVKQFEELEIWQEARRLTQAIYRLTKTESFLKDFALRDQVQRAAVSVMSNIAEGFERGGNQEFIQFLYVAKASCGEVRSQIYVALDQGYMSKMDSEESIIDFRRLSGMIGNLINYLRRSGLKGAKFSPSRKSD
jgi:four helix bundle protein